MPVHNNLSQEIMSLLRKQVVLFCVTSCAHQANKYLLASLKVVVLAFRARAFMAKGVLAHQDICIEK
jgi:hypothetical protein